MSRLAAVLMQLRADAKAHPGEWQEFRAPHGLKIAWRTRLIEGQMYDWIALKRVNIMPSVVEQRTILANVPAELAPYTRTIHRDRHLVVLILRERVCGGCGKPLPAQAKMELRENCHYCPQEGERKCVHCGHVVSRSKGTDLTLCVGCADAMRRAQKEARQLERAR